MTQNVGARYSVSYVKVGIDASLIWVTYNVIIHIPLVISIPLKRMNF